jgi:hypothetical protein
MYVLIAATYNLTKKWLRVGEVRPILLYVRVVPIARGTAIWVSREMLTSWYDETIGPSTVLALVDGSVELWLLVLRLWLGGSSKMSFSIAMICLP